MTNDLHIPNLTIKNFRGIDHLEIPKFGRVTLLVGKNGIGKTTVLDAVRLYCGKARPDAVGTLLLVRQEVTDGRDDEGRVSPVPALNALFHDDDISKTVKITSGLAGSAKTFSASILRAADEELPLFPHEFAPPDIFRIDFDGNKFDSRVNLSDSDRERFEGGIPPLDRQPAERFGGGPRPKLDPPLRCITIGPGHLTQPELVTLWDQIALRDGDAFAREMLGLMVGSRVEGITTIGSATPNAGAADRRIAVRLDNSNRPVPIQRLGDGALHLFEIAIGLANIAGGILLIDEFENGLHYLIQQKIWEALIEAAIESKVQIIATTHSADCVHAFAQAASDLRENHKLFYRLSQRNGELRAVEYQGEKLGAVAEYDIEAR